MWLLMIKAPHLAFPHVILIPVYVPRQGMLCDRSSTYTEAHYRMLACARSALLMDGLHNAALVGTSSVER